MDKLIARCLLYVFLAFLVLTFIHSYRVFRTERVSTRFSLLLAGGPHELVVSLPSGRFQIQYTREPNVSPAIIVPPDPVLPAPISTSILRQDGSPVVQPTQKEYLTFAVVEADAFQPLRLLVSITETNECKIYMNIASGF
jgi:hypothetical protein